MVLVGKDTSSNGAAAPGGLSLETKAQILRNDIEALELLLTGKRTELEEVERQIRMHLGVAEAVPVPQSKLEQEDQAGQVAHGQNEVGEFEDEKAECLQNEEQDLENEKDVAPPPATLTSTATANAPAADSDEKNRNELPKVEEESVQPEVVAETPPPEAKDDLDEEQQKAAAVEQVMAWVEPPANPNGDGDNHGAGAMDAIAACIDAASGTPAAAQNDTSSVVQDGTSEEVDLEDERIEPTIKGAEDDDELNKLIEAEQDRLVKEKAEEIKRRAAEMKRMEEEEQKKVEEEGGEEDDDDDAKAEREKAEQMAAKRKQIEESVAKALADRKAKEAEQRQAYIESKGDLWEETTYVAALYKRLRKEEGLSPAEAMTRARSEFEEEQEGMLIQKRTDELVKTMVEKNRKDKKTEKAAAVAAAGGGSSKKKGKGKKGKKGKKKKGGGGGKKTGGSPVTVEEEVEEEMEAEEEAQPSKDEEDDGEEAYNADTTSPPRNSKEARIRAKREILAEKRKKREMAKDPSRAVAAMFGMT